MTVEITIHLAAQNIQNLHPLQGTHTHTHTHILTIQRPQPPINHTPQCLPTTLRAALVALHPTHIPKSTDHPKPLTSWQAPHIVRRSLSTTMELEATTFMTLTHHTPHTLRPKIRPTVVPTQKKNKETRPGQGSIVLFRCWMNNACNIFDGDCKHPLVC